MLCSTLKDLAKIIRSHYPGLLRKTYIINRRDECLASLDILEHLLKNIVLLQNSWDLPSTLGSQILTQ